MPKRERSMRADARRNHDALLEAARDLFIERGPDAAMDEIARRAGVGVATLYRRFANRTELARAVVLSALTDTIAASEVAHEEHADPADAFSAYVYAVLELRTSALIPALLDIVLDEPEIAAALTQSVSYAEGLLSAAQVSGSLRPDVTFGDVGLMLARLARPVPGLSDEMEMAFGRRHAELFLHGLRVDSAAPALTGPAFELSYLQRLRDQERALERPNRAE
jgi:AcrR family transcriptional regulator